MQQHSVFVEIVVEQEEDREQIHKFAAVVGLIKECKKVRNVFDNAVLWFNDQFLFGDKVARDENFTGDALGVNPEDNELMKEDGTTGRWGGCFTPDGFAHAIGKDDPFGLGPVFEQDAYPNRTINKRCEKTSPYEEGADGLTDRSAPECDAPDDHMDMIKQLIDLDNRCQGCIFEYQSSFFISDPNIPNSPRDVSWVVDKMVYPVSVFGNFFQEGEDNFLNEGDCTSDNGTVAVSDPRDGYPHHDRCRDDVPPNNHRCPSGEEERCQPPEEQATHDFREVLGSERANGTDTNALVEPLFSVHLQVDPLTDTGMGFVDRAPWEYEDGSITDGMPLVQDPDEPAFEDCKTDRFPNSDYECAIEYNFLLAVDFAAFDDGTLTREDEIREDEVEHGEGVFPQPKGHEGNSHPHHPNAPDKGPKHTHDTVNLDIFFHETAPFFVMDNPYWDENGAPPSMNQNCSTTDDHTVEEERRQAVEDRTPIVCDTDRDDSQFHAHDGSQTPRPAE